MAFAMRRGLRRAGIAAAALVTLVLLSAVASLWLVPWLAQRMLPGLVSAELGRPASVGAISFDPLRLQLELTDLRIGAGDAALLGVGRIAVNLSSASVLKRAPSIESLRIERPVLRLAREANGRLDIQDMLDRLAARPRSDGPTPAFVLADASLTDGRIEFDDRLTGVAHRVDGLSLSLPFLSSRAEDREAPVRVNLALRLDGAPWKLDANLRPFQEGLPGSAQLSIGDTDLARYAPYVPRNAPLRLTRATVGTELSVGWALPPSSAPSLKIEGAARLTDVDLRDPRGGALFRARAIAVAGLTLEPLARRYAIDALTVDAPVAVVRREARDARFLEPVLAQVDAMTSAPVAAPSSTPPPAWSVANIQIEEGSLDFADERFRPAPLKVSLSSIQALVTGLSDSTESTLEYRLSARMAPQTTLQAAGQLARAPLTVQGDANVEGLALQPWWWLAAPQVGFDLAAGSLAVSSRYRVADRGADLSVALEGLAARLSGLVLRERRHGTRQAQGPEWLSLPALSVEEASVDLSARRVALGSLQSKGGRLTVRRDEQGHLNLAALGQSQGPSADPAAPVAPSGTQAASAGTRGSPAPSAAADPQPWQVALGRLSLEGFGIDLQDQGAGRDADLSVRDLRVRGSDLTTAGTRSGRIDISARLPGDGQLSVAGPVSIVQRSARLGVDVRGLPILPFQPYFADGVGFHLTRGRVSAKGDLDVAMPVQGAARADWRGAASVDDFAAVDRASGEDLLRWKSIAATPVKFRLTPLALDIGEVALTDAFARLSISPEGRFNLKELISPPADASGAPPQDKPEAAPAPREAGAPAPDIRIGRVALNNVNVDFTDQFIKPNYSANLTGLSGSISDLLAGGDGKVDLRGRIDNAGSVQITGALRPFDTPLSLDIRASARDIDLPKLSPYSVKYVGYGIEKGKLSADIRYNLQGRALAAENNLILDQLTFGDKVETPSVLNLPVRFAVALLKDRNGVIDVNLPISGSLDDPQFSIGSLIWKIIGNLIVKAVTAPFSLLASVFGGSPDQLSSVPFAPGSAQLDKTGEQAVERLAAVLEKRPGLRLDVSGRADSVRDAQVLKEAALEARLKAAKLATLVKTRRGAASIEEIQVEPAERGALLEQLWRAQPARRTAKAPDGQAMREQLLADMSVGESELRDLASRRAVAVKDRLSQAHGADGQRVFVTAPRLDAEPKPGTEGAGSQAAAPDASAAASRVDLTLN